MRAEEQAPGIGDQNLPAFAIVDGALEVPGGPGLGVQLDELVAAANPYRAPRRLAGVRVGATSASGDARRGLPDRFVGDR